MAGGLARTAPEHFGLYQMHLLRDSQEPLPSFTGQQLD